MGRVEFVAHSAFEAVDRRTWGTKTRSHSFFEYSD